MSELEIFKFEQLENLVHQLEKDVHSLIICLVVLFVLFVITSILLASALLNDKR